MRWNIPQPHAVPDVKPPSWDFWGRLFTLVSVLILFVSAAAWVWRKDAHILLYAFSALLAWTLVCALIVGWVRYRYGVERKAAQAVRDYNRLWQKEWQRWGQESLPVLDYSAILPAEIPPVSLTVKQVASEEAFSPGPYPGAITLLRELLLPLHSGLRVLLEHHSLAVSLPYSFCERDFHHVLEELGLPLTDITLIEPDNSDILTRLFNWTHDVENRAARLVIFTDWDDAGETTQGAAAWLLGPMQHTSPLPVRCCLHRPQVTTEGDASADLRQFLRYQPLAQQASDLWLNAGSLPLAAPFMIQRTACLQTLALNAELTQHYLPHWLGKVSDESAFFAITLMMQMAECRKGTQVLLHAGKKRMTFCSVSAGGLGGGINTTYLKLQK
ncbi:hypothetical protein [Enterobacter sp. Bisph1]|uniref:hypothetical protein n=1 Tax=Enterobacter sp. Bisph1 TaxID=1274399 RepID=UPI00068BA94C|nr:hypothetical protein [Enterobacter sp. Bisph1]